MIFILNALIFTGIIFGLQKFLFSKVHLIQLSGKFWSDFLKLLIMPALIIFPEKIRKIYFELKTPIRSRELILASSTSGFFVPLLLTIIINQILPWNILWSGELARLSSVEVPPDWIFFLSTNYLMGALIGFGFGLCLRLLIPVSGVSLWISLQGLSSGVLSLGFAWGIFLGEFFAGNLKLFWGSRDVNSVIKASISVVFCIGLLLFTPFIQNFVQGFGASVQARLIQFLFLVVSFLVFELGLSMTFFHFKHQFSNRAKVEDSP